MVLRICDTEIGKMPLLLTGPLKVKKIIAAGWKLLNPIGDKSKKNTANNKGVRSSNKQVLPIKQLPDVSVSEN